MTPRRNRLSSGPGRPQHLRQTAFRQRQSSSFSAHTVNHRPGWMRRNIALLLSSASLLLAPASGHTAPLSDHTQAQNTFQTTVGSKSDIVDYINPMIGASTSTEVGRSGHGLGKTFPGPATPFGLVQLSPDTRTGGDNGPGYSWHHPTIEGFSFIHMSGIGWYGDFGNLLVTPSVGPLHTYVGDEQVPRSGYRSAYSHDTEEASAGYYAVTLDDYDIRVELTSARRAGMIRMTFPESDTSRISLDLARRIGGSATEQFVRVVNDTTIQGWIRCTARDGGWGNGDGNVNYTVYFYGQFSRPITQCGTWSATLPMEQVRLQTLGDSAYRHAVAHAAVKRGNKSAIGRHIGFFSEFPTRAGEQVLFKAGISFVSAEGARRNLEHDIPHWDFDAVHEANRSAWRDALSRMEVTGSDRDKTIFYTALYHTMIDPRDVADTNGEYVGGDGQIHRNTDYVYRSIFSGWDVFRSQFPLQTLINPRMVNDQINSLISLADVSGRGYFPRCRPYRCSRTPTARGFATGTSTRATASAATRSNTPATTAGWVTPRWTSPAHSNMPTATGACRHWPGNWATASTPAVTAPTRSTTGTSGTTRSAGSADAKATAASVRGAAKRYRISTAPSRTRSSRGGSCRTTSTG